MQRADRLKYVGGNMKPRRYFTFAPARDLEARDIARLSDDEYAALVAPDGGSGEAVYVAGETDEEREERLAARRAKDAERRRREKQEAESTDTESDKTPVDSSDDPVDSAAEGAAE
jgi:hypothetical protein